jgi:hypothetical protein
VRQAVATRVLIYTDKWLVECRSQRAPREALIEATRTEAA